MTSAARRDLDEIWEYIAADNKPAADRLISKIVSVAKLLARQSGLGTRCEELGLGLRRFPVRPYDYVLFYRSTDEGIRVIRVLHGRRDIPTCFEKSRPKTKTLLDDWRWKSFVRSFRANCPSSFCTFR